MRGFPGQWTRGLAAGLAVRSNQTCLDLCVARRPLTRVNVRNVNATVLLHAFD